MNSAPSHHGPISSPGLMPSPVGERPRSLPALRFLKLLGPQTLPQEAAGPITEETAPRERKVRGQSMQQRPKEPGGLWGRGRGGEPPAWISGRIQCLQKERTRSHHSNLEPSPCPRGKPQVPGRKQIPTGFIFPLSLFQVPWLSGEEGEELLLGSGARGSSGSEPGELRASPGPAPGIRLPREFNDSSTVTERERVWQKHSRDTDLPGWGPGKHTTQLLPDGTFLQAPSLAPSCFPQTPSRGRGRESTGFGFRSPESPGLTPRRTPV